jgi:hypothetical protein
MFLRLTETGKKKQRSLKASSPLARLGGLSVSTRLQAGGSGVANTKSRLAEPKR